MSLIGTVIIKPESLILDGNSVTLHAGYGGDAAAPVFTWTPPAGSLQPAGAGGERLIWNFVAATDDGTWTVTVTDPAATDSPQTATINLGAVQAITRFGRLYAKHNPGPTGPDCWILAGPGLVPDAYGGNIDEVVLDPKASAFVEAGNPIYLEAMTGKADRAQANRFKTCVAIGIVISGGLPGTRIGFTADGKVSRADWTTITGQASLKPGQRYFISPSNAGKLSDIPTQVAGEWICPVGRALSTTTLEVELQPPVGA